MSAPAPRKPTSRTGPASLSDFRKEDQEKGQAFFTGGSGTGGCEVYDPAAKAADNIVKKAQEGGADGPAPNTATMPKIVLWKNGFTVNGQELRSYLDPANASFLSALEKGFVPAELAPQGSTEIDVDVEDKRTELYNPPPPPSYVAFSGGGQTLRSDNAPAAAEVMQGASKPVVDESQPTTSVQIRLADGRRMVVKLNHTHTVRDLRAAIDAENPAGAPYNLQILFPRKALTDASETIQAAGLIGASIQQTM
eukprot:TRINITY_DN15162_c0_g1_i1.p1 TRINITY_DN15162_c0_g1~~TRINITY_DN15162_c0_g1_i1.p1  ORF type:complete len:259 (+),score=55.18 TRINITY_DN15162_c0_g1_i1:22-777(+)